MLGLETLTSKLIAAGVATAVLCVIVYLGYRHYDGLVQDKARLTSQVAQLEVAVQTQKAATQEALLAVAEWKADRAKMLAKLDEVNRNAREARREAAKTQQMFSEHDLGALAKARPGLIANRVNAGTDRALRMLSCASAPGGRCPDEGRPAQ